MPNSIPTFGVLLVNLGTPQAPTPTAVRKYLKEFLSDPRVITLPRFCWLPLLYGLVLPFRPYKVVKNYQKIWMKEGSPLAVITQQQRDALQESLKRRLGTDIPVEIGMCYGSPSLAEGLFNLKEAGVKRLLILPLYPQYSATTTAAVFDKIAKVFSKEQQIPHYHFVRHYYEEVGYIAALVSSIKQHWDHHGKGELLLFSFHGIPKAYYESGDLYPEECHATAKAVAERLGLEDNAWQVTFQSRFGKTEWVKPYTLETLARLGEEKLKRVDIISPGFSADCLETLEELAIQNKEVFQNHGGGEFYYIPALNAKEEHINFLTDLVLKHSL